MAVKEIIVVQVQQPILPPQSKKVEGPSSLEEIVLKVINEGTLLLQRVSQLQQGHEERMSKLRVEEINLERISAEQGVLRNKIDEHSTSLRVSREKLLKSKDAIEKQAVELRSDKLDYQIQQKHREKLSLEQEKVLANLMKDVEALNARRPVNNQRLEPRVVKVGNGPVKDPSSFLTSLHDLRIPKLFRSIVFNFQYRTRILWINVFSRNTLELMAATLDSLTPGSHQLFHARSFAG